MLKSAAWTAALAAGTIAGAGCSKKEEAKQPAPSVGQTKPATPAQPDAARTAPAPATTEAPAASAEPPLATPAPAPAKTAPAEPVVIRSGAGAAPASGSPAKPAGATERIPGEQVVVASVVFDAPKAWKKETPGTMRAAQMSVGNLDGGEGAEVAFFHFGAAGAGGVTDNLARWKNMVTNADGAPAEPEVETFSVGDMHVTQIMSTGTFAAGMPGGPKTTKADFTLLGAILEGGPEGNVFVRMTGPKAVVAAARTDWDAMLRSARAPMK